MRLFIRTFWAAFKKEFIIFTRYKINFIMAIYWPFIYPFYLIFLAKGMAGPNNEGIDNFRMLAHTTDYVSFMVIGAILWMFVNFNLWTGGLSLFTERVRGTFETQWISPSPKIAIVLGHTMSSIAQMVIPMVAITFVYNWLGFVHISGDFVGITVSILVSIPFLLGFLLLFTSLTLRVRNSSMIVQIIRSFLTLLCGFQFPFAILPNFLQDIGKYIPLKYTVDIFRGMLMENKTLADLKGAIIFVLLSGFGFLIAGIATYYLVNRSVKVKGLSAGY